MTLIGLLDGNIELIQERIKAGSYLVKSHVIQHALKEGFQRKHIVEAVLKGKAIEWYPDEHRVLICGRTTISKNVIMYMHVVCEYADPIYVEFVTAYIPDETLWEYPPFQRRKNKKK